jgi:hypothetical protein
METGTETMPEASPKAAPAPRPKRRPAIKPPENQNQRWRTAGAERRGRATVHWSNRAK